MPEKIARVTKAAGLEAKEAKLLASKVADWVHKSGKEQVSTLEIRDKVVAELRKVNQYVANLFEWYEKNKKKHLT